MGSLAGAIRLITHHKTMIIRRWTHGVLGWLGVFHLPVSLAEVIEPFKRIPLKVWACNFCSLTAHDPVNDECGLPIICIFLAFLFCIVLKVVHSTIKGVKHKYRESATGDNIVFKHFV